jgi:DNA-binding transcriptional regulator LsrR (DeoR family)
MMQGHMQATPDKKEYHIAFAGGRCLRELAKEFAQLLRRPEPIPHLPEKITFHAMVGGFTDRKTETDPNFFFPYFVVEGMRVETELVALYVPGLLTGGQIEQLRKMKLKLIDDAWDMKRHVDLIITSAGHWADEHSTCQTLLRCYKESHDRLKAAKPVGDVCWQPYGQDGPIELANDRDLYQAMVLFKLKELPRFITQGKQVLLVLGPCGMCNQPKHMILAAILRYHQPLITQLVVDSQTARNLIVGSD